MRILLGRAREETRMAMQTLRTNLASITEDAPTFRSSTVREAAPKPTTSRTYIALLVCIGVAILLYRRREPAPPVERPSAADPLFQPFL